MPKWSSGRRQWSAKPRGYPLIGSNLILGSIISFSMRNKDKHLSNPFRKIKHFPYGGKKCTGYGGELYSRDPRTGRFTEICGIIINKSRERFKSKLEIRNELMQM